ncbi:histone H2A-K119 [Mactra antiquata]
MDSDDNDLKEINSEQLSKQMTSVVGTLEKQDLNSTANNSRFDKNIDADKPKHYDTQLDNRSDIIDIADGNIEDNVDEYTEMSAVEEDHDEASVIARDHDETSGIVTDKLDMAGNISGTVLTEKSDVANDKSGVEEEMRKDEQFNNVQIKVIDVPPDDELFDFLRNDEQKNDCNEPIEIDSDEEIPTEIRKGELYRYLTSSGPITQESNEVTPYHSGNESEASGHSDSVVYLSTDEDSDHNETTEVDNNSRPETPTLEIKKPSSFKQVQEPKNMDESYDKMPDIFSGNFSEKTLERLEKCKNATDKWLKDLELPQNLSLDRPLMFKITDLNQYLTCGLCKGYLYEASTITECMHTFCKNCIVRHCMEVSLHCPVCSILIHPTDPFVHIRLDRMIQDIVYKILPRVAATEFQNIKDFYIAHPEIEPQEIPEPPEELEEESPPSKQQDEEDLSLKQQSMVSIILESDQKSIENDFTELDKKFVRVVSRATIENICTFLKTKLSLEDNEQVSIYCCGNELDDLSCTLENVQTKYFPVEDPLVFLQYKIFDDSVR